MYVSDTEDDPSTIDACTRDRILCVSEDALSKVYFQIGFQFGASLDMSSLKDMGKAKGFKITHLGARPFDTKKMVK